MIKLIKHWGVEFQSFCFWLKLRNIRNISFPWLYQIEMIWSECRTWSKCTRLVQHFLKMSFKFVHNFSCYFVHNQTGCHITTSAGVIGVIKLYASFIFINFITSFLLHPGMRCNWLIRRTNVWRSSSLVPSFKKELINLSWAEEMSSF